MIRKFLRVVVLIAAGITLLTLPRTLAAAQRPILDDQIVVKGQVFIWSLEEASGFTFYPKAQNHATIQGGKYIPARNIFVQAEFFTLSSDVSSYSWDDGSYWIKKSGLSEGTYDVDVEVRAEAILDKLGFLFTRDITVSVFNDSSDIYPFNGQTADHSVHTGNAVVIDIYIGGPQNNIAEWWDDTYWDLEISDFELQDYSEADDHKGIHPVVAFWMTQVMQDAYTALVRLAPRPEDMDSDTWIIYPSMDDTSHYAPYSPPPGIGSIDIAREELFPSQFDTDPYGEKIGVNWTSLRHTLYHEYTHKIMHEAYWAMPKPNVEEINEWGSSEHTLTTCKNQELAWTEGFGEFIPAALFEWPTVNGELSQGHLEHTFYPPELLDATDHILVAVPGVAAPQDVGLGSINWHQEVLQDCADKRENEGVVAAVLWDIFDSKGWEYLPDAVQELRPAEWSSYLMWYDSLSDPNLEDIWDEMRLNSPDSINDEGDIKNDSFWTDWLEEYSDHPALIHGLKAILYNRGIPSSEKPENSPQISDFTIDPTTHRISFTVSEVDEEDQPFLFFNVGIVKRIGDEMSFFYSQDRLVSEVSSNNTGDTIQVSMQPPRGKLGREMTLLVHDSMQPAFATTTFTVLEKKSYLGKVDRLPTSSATAIAIQGSIVYMADLHDGLYTFSLADPLHPKQLALLPPDKSGDPAWYDSLDVAVQGNYAYIAAYSGALVVVDVSDPAHPTVESVLNLNGTPQGLLVDGNLVYLATGGAGLAVVDVSLPSMPELVGTLPLSGEALDVAQAGNYLVVAGGTAGMHVVIKGTSPSPRATIPVSPGDLCAGVAGDSTGIATMVSHSGGLQVYDLSTLSPIAAAIQAWIYGQADPETSHPIFLGSLPLDGMPHNLVVENVSATSPTFPSLWIAQDSGVGSYDLTLPELTYQVSYAGGLSSAMDVAVRREAVYVASGRDGLVILQRSDQPLEDQEDDELSGGLLLEKVGELNLSVSDIAFADHVAYLSARDKGLFGIDISDPGSSLKEVFSYRQSLDAKHTLDGMGLDVQGEMLYLSSYSGDLHLFNLSDPKKPERSSIVSWNLEEDVGNWSELDVAGDFAYICAGLGGIRVVNISDGQNPVWGGTVDTITDCEEIAVLGDYAYVIGFDSGLSVYNVVTNRYYNKIASWSLPEGGTGINYFGLHLDEANKRLYIAADWKGLYILDISDPFNPTVIGRAPLNHAYNVTVWKGFAFVGGDGVVQVVDVRVPSQPVELLREPLSEIPELDISANVVAVNDGYLFVAASRQKFLVYKIIPGQGGN